MTDVVNIACASDENLLIPLLALCHSLERHTPPETLHIHLMHGSMSDRAFRDLNDYIASSQATFFLYKAEGDYAALCEGTRFPPAAYFRLELLDRIPASRCLYLDADIMVRCDLTGLFQLPLDGSVLAAVEDYVFQTLEGIPFDRLSYDGPSYIADVIKITDGAYFNSGAMLVDLNRWRADNIRERAISFCSKNRGLFFVDQDGLNFVLKGQAKLIPARFNALAMCKYFGSLFKLQAIYPDLAREWSDDPAIVHFAGYCKPWELLHYPTDFDEEFWDALKNTRIGALLNDRLQEQRTKYRGHPELARPDSPQSVEQKQNRADALRICGCEEIVDNGVPRWVGELICTLSRAATGGRSDLLFWKQIHAIGVAIIKTANVRSQPRSLNKPSQAAGA